MTTTLGLRMAVRIAGAVCALGLVLGAGLSPASAATPASQCRVGVPLVDVTYRFLNEQDLTSNGDVWALDDGFSRFRLYRTGADTFCAVSTPVARFTAFGGVSPGGTGTVPAGLTGHVAGSQELHFVGTFAPALPTRGFVGTFDSQCDQFDCLTPTQFGRKYLEVAGPPETGSYRFVYASRCGALIQTDHGERGDIAC